MREGRWEGRKEGMKEGRKKGREEGGKDGTFGNTIRGGGNCSVETRQQQSYKIAVLSI